MIIKRDCIYTPNGKNRPLHIYLPDDYYYSNEQYPVMYFFDGHNLYNDEEASYGKSWGLRNFMENWPKKMIIVGMQCSFEGQDRLSEYLPYQAEPGYFAQFKPLGDATFQWIINVVKPMIDNEYRTYPFRECTGIAGASMGGLMAVYGGVHYNQYFSKAACVSSALACCMPAVRRDMESATINPDTRMYLSWGTKEVRGLENIWEEDTHSYCYRNNTEVANTVAKWGAATMTHCQVGGAHFEADWEKLVPTFMDFLWMR